MMKKLLLLSAILITASNLMAQTPSTHITADNSKIQYYGRMDFSNPLAPEYSWAGVYIKAKFKGTAIDVIIKDFGVGGATTTNYYAAIIDGQEHNVFAVNSTDTLYTAATGLADYEHTISLFKRTEASVGRSSFKGFMIQEADLLDLDPKPTRKIEFIGDSWTAAYGNEVNIPDPPAGNPNTGFNSVNEDNYHGWGAITARRLGAQYMCTAYSGRGMYRNNTGSTIGTLPVLYDQIHPDFSSPAWNPANYSADVIVVKLGSNDFAPETWATPNMLDSASFVSTYINFVQTLRGYHALAKIIVVFGSSKSDWWPVGLQHLTRWRNYSNAIVSTLTGGGDTEVYQYELPTQTAPYGEDWHPSMGTHVQMADHITPYIQSITGWSGGTADCNEEEGGTATLDGCSRCVGGQTSLTACVPTGIEDELADVNLYPNPSNGIYHINGEVSEWRVVNAIGQVVANGSGSTIDISNNSNGSYQVIINIEGSAKSIRVLKY